MIDALHRRIGIRNRLKNVRLIAALISIIILYIAVNTENPLNNDGILYLKTAEAFLQSGWNEAMRLYNWPFYSVFIASVSNITHLPLEKSAYLLNGALFILLVYFFITLIKELGGSLTAQIIGAIIILSHARLHSYQHYIIRGFGYWAFSLAALLGFVRYFRRPCWRFGIEWGLWISVATLFRPEGMVLCCLGPLVLLLRPKTTIACKLKSMLVTYSLHLVILTILILCWTASPKFLYHSGRMSEFLYQLQNGWHMIGASVMDKSALISKHVLPIYSEDWGLTMAVWGAFGIYAHRLINTIDPLNSILCLHSTRKRLLPASDGVYRVLAWFTFLNLIVPAIILYQTYYLSHRFLIPATLLIILWAPFSVEQLYQKWRKKETRSHTVRWIFPMVAISLVLMLAFTFKPPKTTKTYFISAGKWLGEQIAPAEQLFTNKKKIAYYAKHPFILWNAGTKVKAPRWRPGDWIALRLQPSEYQSTTKRLSALGLSPIKTFENKKGNRKIIILRK